MEKKKKKEERKFENKTKKQRQIWELVVGERSERVSLFFGSWGRLAKKVVLPKKK